jgi:DeoR family transcriptional regulator, fructose operon transcriptional repressor
VLVAQLADRGIPPHERLTAIEEHLRADGSVRIDDLASTFGVSEMTVRRDLDELEAIGVARRVRGGAVLVGPETFVERHRLNAKAKARIAEKLLDMVPASGTIAMDASSTIHRLAAAIEGARDLVVVTNGLDTFEVLQERPGVTAVLTGGTREPRTGSLVGPIATRSAGDLLFDVFFCSSAAVDPVLGSSEASLAESEVKRGLAQNSVRTILAVDHTKLGTRAQARMFQLDQLELLVTDLAPDDRRLTPYRATVRLR